MMNQASNFELDRESPVTVLGPDPSDTEALLAMLGRCSRMTLFHRFHGFTDGTDYFGTLLRDRPADGTLLAWHHSWCVGVASLAQDAEGKVELGVLIEDAWQHRGIGTQLAASLLNLARADGVTTVHAEVLGDDSFILEALRRMGPLTVSVGHGTLAIDVELS